MTPWVSGRGPLPTAEVHGGPPWLNQHWLSRLPARVKPYKYRLKAAAYLRRARARFARETPEFPA